MFGADGENTQKIHPRESKRTLCHAGQNLRGDGINHLLLARQGWIGTPRGESHVESKIGFTHQREEG